MAQFDTKDFNIVSNPCPYRYKYELIEWAMEKWPNEPKKKWINMKRSQLFAIWYSERRKMFYAKPKV